ncbi:MAG: tetraacyldisaccharide 4'-kinase [Chloroherpetonaceae bacterium]|nr:tetraacyldisaccharide 4'-kinase [Chloroherpetonaceae bacterium]
MRFFLYIAAWLYGLTVSVRNWLFDRGILCAAPSAIPVISVGNLTVGGVGKTPTVDWIVKFYQREGKRVAVVSRGYKRKTKGVVLVGDGELVRVSADEAGDEPLMLARRNPTAIVVVAEKRLEAIKFIEQHFQNRLPDVVVLDDGFQHRWLRRTLDIVVIHAEQNVFKDSLLPLGRLREPTQSLARAQLILLSKVTKYLDLQPLLKGLEPFQKPIVQSSVKIVGLRSFFSSELVPLGTQPFLYTWAFAFSGIGDPKNFMETLQYAGLIVEHAKHFPDHHDYTEADIDFILSETVRHGSNIIVTTEKDFYRLKAKDKLFERLRQAPCFYLEIEFEMKQGCDKLEALLRAAAQAKHIGTN